MSQTPRRSRIRAWRSPSAPAGEPGARVSAEAVFGPAGDCEARLVAALRHARRAAGRADYDADRHRALVRRVAECRRERRRRAGA